MTTQLPVQNQKGHWYSSVRVRTNLVALTFGLVLALMAAALLHVAHVQSQQHEAPSLLNVAGNNFDNPPLIAHSRLLAGLALLSLLLYMVIIPWYLRGIYRLMRTNNDAVQRLMRGETDLPTLPLTRRDEFGQTARALLRLRDLTVDLRRKALSDTLTGLANREGLKASLDAALENAREPRRHAALLLLDLKRFRHLNHAYGVHTGDLVLQEAALRLQAALPQAVGIARLQADRYGLVLSLPQDPAAARSLAQEAIDHIRQQLSAPLEIDSHKLTLDARAGVALFPQDGHDVQTLMTAAEAALALVRHDGSEGLRFADPDLAKRAQRTAGVVAEIRHGILAGEFLPHYEPIVDLGSGDIRGAEALARWSHPQRGLVSPAEFIPMAEDMGMIESLTSALLPQICADAAAWSAAGDPRGISLNLSARELNQGFVTRLADAIQQSGLDPRRVTVELTETAIVERPDQALEVMLAIKALGVTLSLDDFGTGFSSLSYLQRFPIDNVKIDRSFVAELPQSPRAKQLVEAILSMARALNLGVVAEGVETVEQARMLAGMGCLRQQGYLYAKALSAAGLSRKLPQIHGQLGQMRTLTPA